ncbi:MAG TPA: tetratricopeptide repeat protein [Victivallales bacterium]|nr:tetratricopeptide repeat protein [Victivallales bacterium]HRR28204.1 tetratricopeptide repeat protein [Victivallales bacterium]HRU00466.1 tetratricopeptide repeat protein [Victivallales bacterium]
MKKKFFFYSFLSLSLAIFSQNENPDELFKLANQFYFGKNGKNKDYKKAFEYYQKAAYLGHKKAAFNLGICYETGKGTEINPVAAFKCYEEAASAGIKEAKYNLAISLTYGVYDQNGNEIIKPDILQAEKILEELTNNSFPPANLKLAELRISQGGEKANSAFELIKSVFNEKDPLCLRLLADCYFLGYGTEKSPQKTLIFLEKASKLGDIEATAKLAHILYYGDGVPKNIQKAIELFKLAAQKNHPTAIYMLATMYFTGENLQQNLAKARELFSISANLGNPKALFYLAVMAQEGIGEEKSPQKAAKLFLEAAKKGDPRSQFNIAQIFKNGIGIPQDISAAEYWFEKAYSNGLKKAQIEWAKTILENPESTEEKKINAKKILNR